ncbi:hypothetical protein, partial [Streptococcus agalactiae]|uniref:hypothetical protein n=1 Tax=Streptococcus agalactiae TaxID=1311 RepID=UPI00210CA488
MIAEWSVHFGKFQRPPHKRCSISGSCFAKISARNPQTGEILKGGVKAGAFVMLTDGEAPSNPMSKHLLLQHTFKP